MADIIVLRDTSLALVSSMHSNAVTFVDLSDGHVAGVVPVGKAPKAIVLSPDQSRAYVHNVGDNTISAIDVVDKRVLGTFVLPLEYLYGRQDLLSMWPSADGARLFVISGVVSIGMDSFDTKTFKRNDRVVPEHSLSSVTRPGGDFDGVIGFTAYGVVSMDEAGKNTRRLWRYCSSHSGFKATAYASSNDIARIAVVEGDPKRGEYDRIIRVANASSRVTVGTYPVTSDVSKFAFSADGKRLFAMIRTGSFVVLDLDKRLLPEESEELLCDDNNEP